MTWVFGASGQLASQIRNGAPYDIYLSANLEFARELESQHHLTAGSVSVYATGRLALFAIQSQFRSLDALTTPAVKHIAIANPAFAPYGAAAEQFLKSRNLWDKLKPKLVYGENIRQTLQLAESGNADAALVSWSLVFDKGGILLPETHQPIRQAGGIVATSKRKNEAKQLLDLLTSPPGRDLLRRFGFGPPQP